MKSSFSAFILILLALTCRGQFLDIGPAAGVSYYIGDINPTVHFSNPQPSFGGLFRYNYNTRWSLKGSLYYGTISANDADYNWQTQRGLQFESNILELSLQAELNYLTFFTGSKTDKFSPYIFVGVGGFLFNPKADFEGQTYSLRDLHTEGQNTEDYPDRKPYGSVGVAFPFGMGLKLSVSKKITIGMEWGLRKTLTDYLDDVSETYYLNSQTIDQTDPAQWLSDPTLSHTKGMYRGNPENKDWYAFTMVFLTYRFNLMGKPGCNDFKNVQKFR